jgi:ATP-dependent DNA helicase RecG
MSDSAIKELIKQGEGASLEFLRDADLKTAAQTVTAFLNSVGGKVIIGVNDAGEIVGAEDAVRKTEKIKKYLSEMVFPNDAWSITTESVDDRNCIVIDVPAGSSAPYAFRDEIFVRQGGQAVAATGRDISNLIGAKQTLGERWERLPTLGSSIRELDDEEIKRTAQAVSERLMNIPERGDAISFLETLNLARYGQVLNSAFVLFAKEPQRRYPQTRVRAARFADAERLEFIDNRIFEGNCFALLEYITGFLQANLPIVSKLGEGNFQRSDKPVYPPFALREAVMNALVHRDYSAFGGSISIAIYPDRIEIWNPGKLPEGMSIGELKTSSVSRLRNPDIAHIFYLRGYIELWGIGVRRILLECEKAGLPEPEWEETGGGIRLTMRMTARADDANAEDQLNHRQIEYLSGVGTGYQIDVKDYLDNYAEDVTERTARRDLTKMVELGYLKITTKGTRKVYSRTAKEVSQG